MDEERSNPRGIASWIQRLGLTIGLAIASEKRLPPTPPAAGDERPVRLGHEVGSVPDQLGVDAQSGSERCLDLFLGVVVSAQSTCGERDEPLDLRNVVWRRTAEPSDDRSSCGVSNRNLSKHVMSSIWRSR